MAARRRKDEGSQRSPKALPHGGGDKSRGGEKKERTSLESNGIVLVRDSVRLTLLLCVCEQRKKGKGEDEPEEEGEEDRRDERVTAVGRAVKPGDLPSSDSEEEEEEEEEEEMEVHSFPNC